MFCSVWMCTAGSHKHSGKHTAYLHARFGVSHDRQQQGEDILTVGASIRQAKPEEMVEIQEKHVLGLAHCLRHLN